MKPGRLVFFLVALLFLGHCGKGYLDKEPLGHLDESDITNKKGVENLLIGAYSLLDGIGGNKSWYGSAASNWIYGSICGSEAYKGADQYNLSYITPIETFSATAYTFFIDQKWGTVYDGVQRANDVLRILPKAKDILPEDKKRIAAEARFLRGHYHFEAKKMWNKIPFIDETVTYANGNYHVANDTSWLPIENDLEYAMDSLQPDSYRGAVGRANKYTAMALLAKAYMFQRKFVQAKPLLEKIINSGKYELRSYHENFNPETTNGRESIFVVQMSVNDGSQGLNGNYGDLLNFPAGTTGECCGFFQPSQYLVNHFKTDAATGLPDLDNFNLVDVDNDEGLSSTDNFATYPGTLDPRLDWTVGRRGIPYLDWGNHPGKDWIGDQDYGGPYSPKKNLFYRSQQGDLTDRSFWGSTTTNNFELIRFADVLLWAAEVEVEIGSLDKAREYVNRVRGRAADSTGWVHTYIDPNNPSLGFTNAPAANYKVGEYTDPWTDKDVAREAVRFERVLELGMEGHRFFDLVRWGIADVEINKYFQKEKLKRTYLDGAVFKKDCNEYFPIPQIQIDLSAGSDGIPKMKQNSPCYH
jgi:hypothetical protein